MTRHAAALATSFAENERQLVLDLLLGRIGEHEFYRRASLTEREAGGLGHSMLARALRDQDPTGVELGLYVGFRFGINADYLRVLLALADESWHTRHEDVVDALGQLRSPASVDVLGRLALSPQPGLDGDAAHALGARCVLALSEVQNRAALLRLGQIVERGTRGVAAKAEAQLERLEGGWARSRGVRGMARLVLDEARARRNGADVIAITRAPLE